MPVPIIFGRKRGKIHKAPSKIALLAKRDLHPSRLILVMIIFIGKRKRHNPIPARWGKSRRKSSGWWNDFSWDALRRREGF
jgi:hypothetical protein